MDLCTPILDYPGPANPIQIVTELCAEPLDVFVSVTRAAKSLGVSRKTPSTILNGRAGISPEMAVRLSIAFNTTAESWMNQQLRYYLCHAEQHRSKLKVVLFGVTKK